MNKVVAVCICLAVAIPLFFCASCSRVPPPKTATAPPNVPDPGPDATLPENEVADLDSQTELPSPQDSSDSIDKQQREGDKLSTIDGAGETAKVAPESETEIEATTKLPPAERIMLLAPSGPLIVDLHITIHGKPYRDSFDSVVEEVMAIADDDKDGTVTWEDIMAHPRFAAGQFGNPTTASYQAQQDMVRLYDTTKNGRVDPDELVRYLTSNRSSSQALSLYTSNYRRMQNRDDSPVRRWLDVDDDLVLDESEIAGASRRLRLRDTNDDEILFPSDFVDASGVRNGTMTRRRSRDSEYLPKVGWLVKENEPWSDMRVAWNHFYSVGQWVRAEDLVVGNGMYGQLDIDKDGSLDNIEMEMLAEVEPHIVLEVELAAGSEPPEIRLAALRLPEEQINAVIQHQANRITIELPETSLDIFASDTIGNEQYDQRAMQLFQQGDGDKNGYLSKDEFDSVAAPFLSVEFDGVDLDGNEMVFQDEVVTVLGQRNMINRNRIDLRADDQDDALLPSLDRNSDGRLDSREISQVGEALLALDENEDGRIQLHELRGSMMLGVVRGGSRGQIVQGDTTFAVPAVVRKPSKSTPRWFNGMDRNRDGSITWREFLGSRQQFDELDADADGFVAVEEIRKE